MAPFLCHGWPRASTRAPRSSAFDQPSITKGSPADPCLVQTDLRAVRRFRAHQERADSLAIAELVEAEASSGTVLALEAAERDLEEAPVACLLTEGEAAEPHAAGCAAGVAADVEDDV